MLGPTYAAHYAGGTNDNASDAQKEITSTFENIMDELRASDALSEEDLHDILHENGFQRRAIAFGDPYHIANLCVTWASIFAFGDTEKADHTQVHHRQLLQSIHSLHSSDNNYSQAVMDEVMDGTNERVRITSKRERVQRWLVNQRNSMETLEMIKKETTDGTPSLVAWGLHFANTSRSGWKRRVGKEVATWVSMPSIILGLQFEAEIGLYFEEIYQWHNRSGSLHKRSGFRMMEVFDLYFGYEVPWWNAAVNDPASKLPKTMQYLEDNFTGADYDFRRMQILRGLRKGQEEMIKMTSRYLLRAPILFLLLCHHTHGGPFLRAMVSILHENPLDDDEAELLVHQPTSNNWGRFSYSATDTRPEDEQQWYDLLSNHQDDVVHWWRQFGLNKECLVVELQKLSRSTGKRRCDGKAPLLVFKADYPILFECLYAVFGMMMSNSRLCEQIHGMMRHGLRVGTGMDQADAQRCHSTETDYELRQERRDMAMESSSERPTKRRKGGYHHSKTKAQQSKLSEQLLSRVSAFVHSAKLLLANAGHGIPSVREVHNKGRRVQDSIILAKQVEAEKDRAATLTRDVVTPEMILTEARATNLSNDRVMKLGEERLNVRMRITEISTKRFWLQLKAPEGHLWQRYVLRKAFNCFPYFLTMMVYRKKDAGRVKTKTEGAQIIGDYLKKSKLVVKLLNEFCHGGSGSNNAVPKRERSFEPGDLLDVFGFFRIRDGNFGDEEEICEPAAERVLAAFDTVDPHYSYTLPADEIDEDAVNVEDVIDVNDEDATQETADAMPHFVVIT